MSKTGAAFTVRFLRNGDQVFVVRNIIDKNGAGAALFQVIDPNSGTVSPDWTKADNQPIIQLGVRSSAGYPAEILGVAWAYDGTTLNFTFNGANWVTASNDNRFQARINGEHYELKIVANLATKDEISNKQITYEVSYVSNAMTDKVQGSADILIQTAGTDSHILQITTDLVELDADNASTTLKAVGYYGTEAVAIGSNGYTLQWYKDGVAMSGQNASTLTVTRDMVTGGNLFIAKLMLNGNTVAQDSQRIGDIADEYQIAYKPTEAGSNYVGLGHNATYTLSVLKNGAEYSGSVTFSWEIFNAVGVKKTSGNGSTVTVTPDNCIVEGANGNNYHADCDVLVTATF